MRNREKLTEAYSKAASDPRLLPELRQNAKRHYKNLQAIAGTESLKTDICFSLDSELMAHGLKLAVFYIEAGVIKFTDVANAIAAELGTNLIELRPYLRCWYNGARDIFEDSYEGTGGMDGPEEVWAAIQMIEDIPSAAILAKLNMRHREARNRVQGLLDDFAQRMEILISEDDDPRNLMREILEAAELAELADVRATYRTETPEQFVMDLLRESYDARAWVERAKDRLRPLEIKDSAELISNIW